MRITDKREKTQVFRMLNVGEVFEDNGEVYIKIAPSIVPTSFRAFNLSSSQLCNFAEDDYVSVVKARLVIE